jgi:hypothetical protein
VKPLRAVDPRTYGVGAGDVVDITIRARITRIGAMSLDVDLAADPAFADFGRISAYVPAESIVSVALATSGGTCGVPER